MMHERRRTVTSTSDTTAQTRDTSGFVEELTDIDDDFDRWYVEVVQKAGLAEDAPIRGCKIVKPYGYAIWEAMQAYLDPKFKQSGVENAYFPMFIPRAYLEREADHVEGFAPEVAWVTRGGGREFPESEWWAVRPTSEAIILPAFGRWIQSYRDLPLLLNQWGSVFRWENRPRAFLRTAEFLWHEGHTAHATADEAVERTLLMLEIFRQFLEELCAIPSIPGRKSEAEKFAGAHSTYTVEAMMGGKKWALQAGTSHYFADHFGRAFDVQFLDRDGARKYIESTSWAVSQRVIGAVIMVHGDDAGLILPPRLAPIQVIGVPIWRKEPERERVEAAMDAALAALQGAGVRARADWSDQRSGWKFNEWELKGVPLRIEVGPRDLASDQVTVVRRDTRAKEQVGLHAVAERVCELLSDVQRSMFERARRFRDDNTAAIDGYDQFKEVMRDRRGFIRAYWCGSPECEQKIKEETRATIRVIPEDAEADGPGACVYDGRPASQRALFAQAY
jgi:prolyl-tRNA synthetase